MISPPTSDEIRAFLETHGLTQKQLSEMLGISQKQLEKWLAGTRNPLPYLSLALKWLDRELP